MRLRRALRRLLPVALAPLLLLTTPPALQAATLAQAAPAPAREPGVAPPLETTFTVAGGVVRRTLAFGPDGLAQTLDVYSPAGPVQPRPTVLLVHGGGWKIGDSTEWAAKAAELVQRGWTAVAVNYRLAPQHVWPAPYDDASAALRLLHARAAELGIDPDRIGAVGDSAGAQLAALLGEPAADRPSLRSVVTWSGVNDLPGVTRQRGSGGCVAEGPCAYRGLSLKLVRDLMGCEPAACPAEYRAGSPAADVTPGHAATLAISSEGEQVDPRQAWVMDAALAVNRVTSRVQVLPGDRHARGFEDLAWPRTLRFLAATLTPEIAPAYPSPTLLATLDLPTRSVVAVGRPVRLNGVVRPRQLGSSVTLQVRQSDGSWRTTRTVPLQRGAADTFYDLDWTPTRPGTTVWRAVWRGGGGSVTTLPRVVVAR